MSLLVNRRLLLEIAPEFQVDASIVGKINIVGCAGIACCGGVQAGFADDKSPEKTETENRVASLNGAMRGCKTPA